MGFLPPHHDELNLLLNPPAVAVSTTTTSLVVPKIEPFETPAPRSEPFVSGLAPDKTSASYSSTISSEEENVYSEFNRVSELFRSAFYYKGFQNIPNDTVSENPDSRAIVTVPPETHLSSSSSSVVVSKNQSNQTQRSRELVRVAQISFQDEQQFRHVVRRTKMTYDSLRIALSVSEKRDNSVLSKRLRADLKAGKVMKTRGLWLNYDKRIVGSIPGIYIGDMFLFRIELCVVGLHGHPQAGIDCLPASQSSNGEPIATSIIVSGGYEDDEDSGEVIIYTGQGGQDKCYRQCEHQTLEGGNLALERSMRYGIEVRVIRGIKYHIPGRLSSKVYVYDGLYKIHDCWFDVGKSGFGVYKYKIVRIEGQAEMGSSSLKLAQSLRISLFSVRPSGYISLDISMKKEKFPVLVYNDIDNDQEPLYYQYLLRTVFPPFAFHHSGKGTGCECVSGCKDDCFCAMKNGGEFAYDQNGFLIRGKPIVFECGPFCKCPPHCHNRVSQNGLKNGLEVFRSRETGWGVRSLDLIHAGQFICEYTGVVLTMDQAQVFSMNGDRLIYPNRFSERWGEWGDLSQINSGYVRPSYPSVPPLDFAMDVSKMRNVACYMSHSLSPNVMVQYVLYDHNNLMFPHLMLFAMENIPPLRELSLDYGIADEGTAKLLICN